MREHPIPNLQIHRPLLHQLLPNPKRLLPTHRPRRHRRERVQELDRHFRQVATLPGGVQRILEPTFLLRGDVGGRGDVARRVDEEEDEDLAEAGFDGVGEVERGDL